MSLVENAPRASAVVARVRCMECGDVTVADRPVTQCRLCGGLLDAVISFDQPISPDSFGANLPLSARMSGVWRYRSLLPDLPDDAIVSRAEGRTPIYWDERLAEFAGLKEVGLKHEGQNPTASFKDRGMTVGMSHAKAVGAKTVACASTGNTSASLASYAAAAGLRALVIVPEGKISGGKLAQTLAHGALVVQVQGDFDDALSLLRKISDDYERYHVYLVNSVNPFRIEGQKTILIELFEQLDWKIPDVVALPGGNLGNTAAFGKALFDLHAAGLIERVPRLATIQAAGAAPFAAYFESGFDHYEPVKAETIATAIKIGAPASMQRARRAIEQSGGVVASVTDDEIMEAKAHIDRVGIGCEPASAASLAGIRKLVREGKIEPDANVVGILTGHLLKDAEAVAAYHVQDVDGRRRPGANRPIVISNSLDAFERVLDADAV